MKKGELLSKMLHTARMEKYHRFYMEISFRLKELEK